jgi:hypothetical protein
LHRPCLAPTQHYELLRILYRQHSQHDGINQTKNGGVGSDAQRQRQYRHGREAGVLRQHAHAEFQVLEQGAHVSALSWQLADISFPFSVVSFQFSVGSLQNCGFLPPNGEANSPLRSR